MALRLMTVPPASVKPHHRRRTRREATAGSPCRRAPAGEGRDSGFLYLVPFIVPFAAHVATPHPPGRNLAPHPPELHPCYIAAYSERVTSRRVLGAWTGVASFLVLVALNATDR